MKEDLLVVEDVKDATAKETQEKGKMIFKRKKKLLFKCILNGALFSMRKEQMKIQEVDKITSAACIESAGKEVDEIQLC